MITLIALALATATVATSVAGADTGATSAKPVDPLAVAYLQSKGLSPAEVTSWTVGACSHEVKADACYTMLEPAAATSAVASVESGFDWGAAGIGAAATLGLVLLVGGLGAGLATRHGRHQQTAGA